MSASTMGRRYERLLFFAGPLALGSLLLLFVAIASDQQDDRKTARCLTLAADAIEAQKGELQKAWEHKPAEIEASTTADYRLALAYSLIQAEVHNEECRPHYDVWNGSAKNWKASPPLELARKLRIEASSGGGKPFVLFGVEIPEKATITALGVPITMNLITAARVMQVALGPVLLLWLGSLYNTRQREGLYIAAMTNVKQLYPHLVNVYPVVVQKRTANKRSWAAYGWSRFGVPTLYALVRIALLLVFAAPPVAFYVTSLYLLDTGSYSYVFAGFGVLVLIFTFANVLWEMVPVHAAKRFIVREFAIT